MHLEEKLDALDGGNGGLGNSSRDAALDEGLEEALLWLACDFNRPVRKESHDAVYGRMLSQELNGEAQGHRPPSETKAIDPACLDFTLDVTTCPITRVRLRPRFELSDRHKPAQCPG